MNLEQFLAVLNSAREEELVHKVLHVFASTAYRFEEYSEVAKCYFRLKDYDRAIKHAELAVTTAYTNDNMYIARSNLINLYNHANQPESALQTIRALRASGADSVMLSMEESFSNFLLGRRDEAESILLRLKSDPRCTEEESTKIAFNLGTYAMYRGDFNGGLSAFLNGGQKLGFWQKDTPKGIEHWDGSVELGAVILIIAEAGIGDEIINIRFAKRIQDMGMQVVWISSRPDMQIISQHMGVPSIADYKAVSTDMPVRWVFAMELPILLNLKPEELWTGPYISNWEPAKHAPADDTGKVRVGLRWRGAAAYDHDLHRSYLLADLLHEVDLSRFSLVSLQKDDGVDELLNAPADIEDMSERMPTLLDLISVIDSLDMVITSCTSVAHIAAAMGKRTFVFVPLSAYYTWTHPTDKSPWYGDNVTILRQVSPRSWKEPMAKLNQILNSK